MVNSTPVAGGDHRWTSPAAGNDDDLRLEVLDETSCLALLRSHRLGWLGFSSRALPVVFPVSYVLDGDRIVFGSGDDEKTAAARDGAVACFEVDDVDPAGRHVWSVLATGRLRLVPADRHPGSWPETTSPSEGRHPPLLVEMAVDLVSGERIERVGPDHGH